jgi:hypothetical protein
LRVLVGIAITTVNGVVYVALLCGVVCLGLAITFAVRDRGPAKEVSEAAEEAGKKTKQELQNPATEQAAIDFGGIAKLAEALKKLDRSGRFLIAGLAFVAIAAAVVGAHSFATQ